MLHSSVIFLLLALPATLMATQPNEPLAPEAPSQEASHLDGIWPTQKLLNSILARWAERTASGYDLDEETRKDFRERSVKRWTEFLTQRRGEIQPLLNEFLEMRMALAPPSKEQVQKWASRVGPVFQEVREEVEETQDDFRALLSPLQRASFGLDALKMSAGLALAEEKLQQWKSGAFDTADFWQPPGPRNAQQREERRRLRRERRATANTAAARKVAPVEQDEDQILIELSAWEQYVVDFVVEFTLDEGQRTSALSCLSEIKQRALDHRNLRRREIDKLEQRIMDADGTQAELDGLTEQLVELYGPIDALFKELKARLDQLPNREQHARVARLRTERAKASAKPGDGELGEGDPSENGPTEGEPKTGMIKSEELKPPTHSKSADLKDVPVQKPTAPGPKSPR